MKVIFLRNILGLNLIASVLVSSFGRELFNKEYIGYYFWLSLGLSLGFGLLSFIIKLNNNRRAN